MASGFDFIGDVHGCAESLVKLLTTLGYERDTSDGASPFTHPQRQAVFLGDLIDRGPEIFKTLRIVRAMLEAGSAYAILGNHEYNAILYHTPDTVNGGFLRSHDAEHTKALQATLEQAERTHENLGAWISWMQTLPLWLELTDALGGKVRAVHACFDTGRMQTLWDMREGDEPFLQGDFKAPRFTPTGLHVTSRRWTEPRDLVSHLLKGPDARIPGTLIDKDGSRRKKIRLAWWKKEPTFGAMALYAPQLLCGCDWLDERFSCPGYAPLGLDCPTFVGHYWLNPEQMRPLTEKLACVDSSCVYSGVLSAYRYNTGDTAVLPERFVSV